MAKDLTRTVAVMPSATVAQSVAAAIKAKFGEQTDLSHTLSYANGVKNILDARYTNDSMRLKISNTGDEDQIVYICPSELLGMPLYENNFPELLTAMAMPAGEPFFNPDKAGTIAVESLNQDQFIPYLAAEFKYTPTQVTGLAMKSSAINATGVITGKDSSNFANNITHYHISSRNPKTYKEINLQDKQNVGDYNLDILKLDFIKMDYPLPISQNDMLAIRVNALTRMDITFQIGARWSPTEWFYRQIATGNKLINDPLWGDSVACKCD